ncbi:uncharacterized protein wu:fa19b12 [Echeneis naucrates]|uniref:uncharacterized protein wu:fa19b12 n=1 Tax=Echeneis naucrates TaxID=173247 RepID=UPI001113B2EA|nr:uncharacterized protein C9orf40 homolog [Echeneis naucrates]
MAKRRAQDTPLRNSPSKRCCRSVCGVDPGQDCTAPAGGVSLSPPSLLALLGSRCRKRPHYFEEQQQEEAAELFPTTVQGDARRKHPAGVGTVQTSGTFHDRGRSSSLTNTKKRPREDRAGRVSPPADDKSAGGDMDAEDCTFNSFQYWRAPLPELDLSLLEDVSGCSPSTQKSNVKDSFSDVMET